MENPAFIFWIIILIMFVAIAIDTTRIKRRSRGVKQPSPGCERNQHSDPGSSYRWPWLASELDDIWGD